MGPAILGCSRCQVCGRWPARALCADCLARFAQSRPRCTGCALALPPGHPQGSRCGRCLRHPPPLTHCLAVVDYSFPWHQLIARFKFQNEPAWARHFAKLAQRHPGVREALAQADLALPVPLSPQRLAWRGYNQAWEWLRALQPRQPLPGALLRLSHGPEQVGLDRAARLRQARLSYAVAPAHAQILRGRQVLLVDDVMTTGATLFSLAELLLRHGAAGVTGLAFARTPQDG